MRVIATNRGFDGHKVREIGDEFDMPEGAKGSWFQSPDEPAPEVAKAPPGAKPKGKAKTASEASPEHEDEIA